LPVTSSTFAYDGPVQLDGSRMVIERHQCANGVPEVVLIYFAAAGFDPSALLPGRAAQINDQLAAAEAAGNLSTDGAPAIGEEAMTTFLQTMRAAYKASDKADTCRLAWWLLRRIAAGHVTDAQCQTAFGRTAAQWTSFKTNTLTPQSNAWAAVIGATGA
jgi:hypothetical protein